MESKDLTKVSPRSPREIIGGYAILARAIDKCRASIAFTNGEYHFNCPVDRMFFDFKGIDAEAFKQKAIDGATDADLLAFVNKNGTPKTVEEIKAWSESVIKSDYHNDPEKKEWFDGECARLGLDPEKNYLFDYLDADDIQSYN